MSALQAVGKAVFVEDLTAAEDVDVNFLLHLLSFVVVEELEVAAASPNRTALK